MELVRVQRRARQSSEILTQSIVFQDAAVVAGM